MENILVDLFKVFWFFLPVGVANMIPIPVSKIGFLRKYDYPIDCYKSFGGKRLLGDHKTVRGLVSGVLAAVVVCGIQAWMFGLGITDGVSIIDYSSINWGVLGALFGIGALGGDSIESFFKRQLGVASGKTWFPFDQLDYILGGILVTVMYVRVSIYYYILIVIIYFVLHLISSFGGYLMGFKESAI
ncbi:MAG: CDP-archaeol synthase [bacterium]|nr:CDP-archaeol synthase [bacterium]